MPPDVDRIYRLLEQAEAADIEPDGDTLGFALRGTVSRLAADWYTEPEDISRLRALQRVVELARSLPFWVDLWKAQNVFYEILQNTFPRMAETARRGKKEEADWTQEFLALGESLKVRTGGVRPPFSAF
jgi:hypothetical protein